ncbi:ABC-type dipeptide/oligopeptide/nickel transport system, ATPase protein I [Halorubrum californiense DSM 19288]|uniref:Nickel import system ATP-binding protein NikD n=1 Tax=Halorubrum californiense DSM 19288 TaxID=1227465 RepID=M0EAA0_9EURY|nr:MULTISPECIES: ABC transporter ATP-binding protein [Halorubrum]ELZ43812.1 ABC-type dipeptide/oligopeptide/nickel transport system, ATPase protein I [Halorubrum californiense DSM 19288]TKX72774.1 ABC transporter ATP-binding protein [Halorubrum sp. GN11GM_10-3_MGM]
MSDAERTDEPAATDGGGTGDAFGSGDAAPTGTPAAGDVLSVRDLSTRFFTEEGQINAVESVSFDLREDEILGVVGESGSGKSVTALSLVDLVETPGRITAGEVWYRDPDLAEEFRGNGDVRVDGDHVDLRTVPPRVRRSLRGPSFSVIFQDPMSSFNPSITVGEQIAEAVEVQRRARANPRSTRSRTQGYGLGKYLLDGIVPGRDYTSEESMERAVELLGQVGIPDPEERVDEYPGQFSGGMLQRAMIAQALAGEPDVLIADEPTTALDVTIQAQILNLLKEIQADRGMSIVLITHDLGVIAEMCDRVCVMYAGEVVERGTLDSVFEDTVHPYTQGLLGSIPDVDDPRARLEPITGNVPSLLDAEMGDRCYFADRCPKAMEACLDKPPETTVDAATGHGAKCVLADREYDPADALPDGYFDAGPGDAAAPDEEAATDGGEGE